MQLLREWDVPANGHDRVFRYSRTHAVLAYASLLAGCAALVAAGIRQHAPMLHVAAAIVVAGLYLSRRFLVARFRESNWLVRANENGVYLHFRSYLNYHFPSNNPTVAFIPYREIRSARSVRERRELPEPSRTGRSVSVQSLQLVELDIACDTTALAAALTDERTRPAPREARWYGNSALKFEHEPLVLTGTDCLHLTWECVPSVETFLAALAPHVSIEESASRSTSYDPLAGLTRTEQERRIGELARSGQLAAAVTVARRLYAYDLRQAREFVQSLRRGGPEFTR